MFKVGDIVKYADGWCTEGEKKYRFIVFLKRDSVEVVDEEMIQEA